MSYNPPSTEDDIRRLNKSIGVVRNLSRFTNVGTNVDQTGYGFGSNSAATGVSQSSQFVQSTKHFYTVDSAGYGHISLISTGIEVHAPAWKKNIQYYVGQIVWNPSPGDNHFYRCILNISGPTRPDSDPTHWTQDDTSPYVIDYVDGAKNDGQYITIRPYHDTTFGARQVKVNKAADLTNTKGNIYTDATTTLNENQYLALYFHKDLGSGGMWANGTSSGGTFTGTIAWSHVTPIDVDKDMNNHSLTNLNVLGFHSSGNPSDITPSGDGTTINFNVNGDVSSPVKGAMSLSNASITTPNAILELYGVGQVSTLIPSLKIFNYNVTPVGTAPAGGISFDQYSSTLVRKTFAQIVQSSTSVTNGSELGELDIYLLGNNALWNGMKFISTGTGAEFVIQGQTGNNMTLTKVVGSPADFSCSDNFIFDNDVLGNAFTPANLGSNTLPWNKLFTTAIQLEQTTTKNVVMSMVSDYIQSNVTDSATNTGHAWFINSIPWLELVHNTANTPNDAIWTYKDLIPSSGTINIGSNAAPYNNCDVNNENIHGLIDFVGTIAATGWASDCYPNGDRTQSLGHVTGTLARWVDLFMSGNILMYEGSSSNQYLQIYKDTTGSHNAIYNLNDVSNPTASHNFYVNAGVNSFVIDGQGTYNVDPSSASIYENTTVVLSGGTDYSVHNFNDGTHTNIGFAWRINGTHLMQMVHNTGNDPINFMFAEQPIWLSGGNQNTYIQFDGMANNPTNPPTGKVRLYVITSGGVNTLEAHFPDGTKITLASH